MKKVVSKKGFTLIEALVYIVLFSIIIGGGLIAAYQIIEGSRQLQTQITIDAEANFILRKIDWALSDVETISIPSSGGSGSTLRVTAYSGDQAEFTLDAGNDDILLERIGGGPATILNSDNVAIENLLFKHINDAGRPPAVETSFEVNGKQFGPTTIYVR